MRAASSRRSRSAPRACRSARAYLFCPESKILPPHRAALKTARDDGTVLTNVMTGRPARGLVNRVMRELGPISDIAPDFPLAGGALAPLHAKAQAQGSGDFSVDVGGAGGRARPRDAGARADGEAADETQALMRRDGAGRRRGGGTGGRT